MGHRRPPGVRRRVDQRPRPPLRRRSRRRGRGRGAPRRRLRCTRSVSTRIPYARSFPHPPAGLACRESVFSGERGRTMPTDEEARAQARDAPRGPARSCSTAAHPGEARVVSGSDGRVGGPRPTSGSSTTRRRSWCASGREGDVNDVLATDCSSWTTLRSPDADPDLDGRGPGALPAAEGSHATARSRASSTRSTSSTRSSTSPTTIDQNNNDDLGRFVASPDHWLHVCTVGNGRICPAVEPKVTDETEPWPPRASDLSLGSGVRVSVVDSGWHPPAAARRGHAVVGRRGRRPRELQRAGRASSTPATARSWRGWSSASRRLRTSASRGSCGRSGAIRESRMVKQLGQALPRHDPHIINLSAGTTTRKNRPLLSFERFFNKRLSPLEGACLLVAAAGNEGSRRSRSGRPRSTGRSASGP